MNTDIFSIDQIIFDSQSEKMQDVFKVMAKLAEQQGFINNEDDFVEALTNREQEVTTGFKDGFAIPHGKSESVIKPGIFLIKCKNPIEWNALDGKPVHCAIGLAIPKEGATEHLKLLSRIAMKLIDDDFRDSVINTNDSAKLYEIIATIYS